LQFQWNQPLNFLSFASQDIRTYAKQIRAHGQEIHDLCQYVIFSSSSTVSQCTNKEIDQQMLMDIDKLEALSGVLKMLVGSDEIDGILACAGEVGKIFQGLIRALIALQLAAK